MRLVVDDEGCVWPDVLQKAPGRGCWLCMQKDCLRKFFRKGGVDRLRRHFSGLQPGQHERLRQLVQQALTSQLERILSLLLPQAAIGRDAVMHRMWQHAPLFVIIADDAGQALLRQLEDAAGKRNNAGQCTALLKNFPGAVLARAGRREKISVIAVDGRTNVRRLQQYGIWLNRMKDAG